MWPLFIPPFVSCQVNIEEGVEGGSPGRALHFHCPPTVFVYMPMLFPERAGVPAWSAVWGGLLRRLCFVGRRLPRLPGPRSVPGRSPHGPRTVPARFLHGPRWFLSFRKGEGHLPSIRGQEPAGTV